MKKKQQLTCFDFYTAITIIIREITPKPLCAPPYLHNTYPRRDAWRNSVCAKKNCDFNSGARTHAQLLHTRTQARTHSLRAVVFFAHARTHARTHLSIKRTHAHAH